VVDHFAELPFGSRRAVTIDSARSR
jgi:hypothetical protein